MSKIKLYGISNSISNTIRKVMFTTGIFIGSGIKKWNMFCSIYKLCRKSGKLLSNLNFKFTKNSLVVKAKKKIFCNG